MHGQTPYKGIRPLAIGRPSAALWQLDALSLCHETMRDVKDMGQRMGYRSLE